MRISSVLTFNFILANFVKKQKMNQFWSIVTSILKSQRLKDGGLWRSRNIKLSHYSFQNNVESGTQITGDTCMSWTSLLRKLHMRTSWQTSWDFIAIYDSTFNRDFYLFVAKIGKLVGYNIFIDPLLLLFLY